MIRKCEEVAMPIPSMTLYDRTDSRDYYEKYMFGRRDIAGVQFWGVANSFVYTDLQVKVQPWQNVEIDEASRRDMERVAREHFLRHAPADYVQRHEEFFAKLAEEGI
jgi:hypothetical protein